MALGAHGRAFLRCWRDPRPNANETRRRYDRQLEVPMPDGLRRRHAKFDVRATLDQASATTPGV
jgi:hypothetical protein